MDFVQRLDPSKLVLGGVVITSVFVCNDYLLNSINLSPLGIVISPISVRLSALQPSNLPVRRLRPGEHRRYTIIPNRTAP